MVLRLLRARGIVRLERFVLGRKENIVMKLSVLLLQLLLLLHRRLLLLQRQLLLLQRQLLLSQDVVRGVMEAPQLVKRA